MEEEVLVGGVANAGAVVRVGDRVLRPARAHADSIHRFLTALRKVGFMGAPEPLGIGPDNREMLVFIKGEVPVPPYPEWAQSDKALVFLAVLMRRFHEASAQVGLVELDWSTEMADPNGGAAVCHNDVCLENVVFRDGEAIALLDFDFAAPGDPVRDLASMARMCVPVDDPVSAANLGYAMADRAARTRLIADAYELDAVQRRELLGYLDTAIGRGGEWVLRQVEAGDRNFIQMWNDIGGMERFDRRRRWWEQNQSAFADSLD